MAETLSTSGNGHSLSSCRTIVVLPAPEGPEMITSLPRCELAIETGAYVKIRRE